MRITWDMVRTPITKWKVLVSRYIYRRLWHILPTMWYLGVSENWRLTPSNLQTYPKKNRFQECNKRHTLWALNRFRGFYTGKVRQYMFWKVQLPFLGGLRQLEAHRKCIILWNFSYIYKYMYIYIHMQGFCSKEFLSLCQLFGESVSSHPFPSVESAGWGPPVMNMLVYKP